MQKFSRLLIIFALVAAVFSPIIIYYYSQNVSACEQSTIDESRFAYQEVPAPSDERHMKVYILTDKKTGFEYLYTTNRYDGDFTSTMTRIDDGSKD